MKFLVVFKMRPQNSVLTKQTFTILKNLLSKDSKVLEVGCGNGWLCSYLVDSCIVSSIHGINATWGAEKWTFDQKNARKQIDFELKSFNDVENTYDLIIFVNSFQFIFGDYTLAERKNVQQKLFDLTNPGGKTFIMMTSPDFFIYENKESIAIKVELALKAVREFTLFDIKLRSNGSNIVVVLERK